MISVCENCGLTLVGTDPVLQINEGYPRKYIHTECPTEQLVQCPLCEEVIGAGEEVNAVSGNRAHRECLLRSVIGGIGHLEDHQRWCIEAGDPDGGRTYRQSAIEVDQWVVEHGIEEATQ